MLRLILKYLVLVLTVLACRRESSVHENTAYMPKLLLTHEGVEFIRSNTSNSIIAPSLEALVASADEGMNGEFSIPIPKDGGGGYTHEKHKANYQSTLSAAHVFLINKDEKYLEYSKKMLLGYAEMYPSLPLHPQSKNQAPGKLFWQILNEEVALVYFIQAFDAINAYISTEERNKIETGLIRPLVSFIKDESANTFSKIHNHAMWGVAGVGMAGFVLKEPNWIDASLKGSDGKGTSGYYRLIDKLFSPDGYYSEGPYYQRYALMPLVLLAQVIEKNRPSEKIFEYKEGVVLKAIETTVNLSSCKGYFFPLNDAIKSKSIQTLELGYALPLVFAFGGKDSKWVSVMRQNGHIMLTDALVGISNSGEEYLRKTAFIRDGAEGDFGGLGILRLQSNCEGITAVLKFGTHGMGHGHFDQLGFVLYSKGEEFISDYGAARFLNIPQKSDGRYLDENTTWASQTIAHNALVVDERSQHEENDDKADSSRSHLIYFLDRDHVKAISAFDSSAYNGVQIQRHIAILSIQNTRLVLDISKVQSVTEHQYDLAYHYKAQLISSLPKAEYSTLEKKVFGKNNGYQHLWLNAQAKSTMWAENTWLKDDHFFTLHSLSNQAFTTHYVETGANDPEGNLTEQKALVYRTPSSKDQIWINVFEQHGSYNTITEKTSGAYGSIEAISFSETDGLVSIQLEMKDQQVFDIQVDVSLDQKNLNSEHIRITPLNIK